MTIGNETGCNQAQEKFLAGADRPKTLSGCAIEGRQETVAEHLDNQLAALNREIARVVTLKQSLNHRVLQSPLSLVQQVVYGG